MTSKVLRHCGVKPEVIHYGVPWDETCLCCPVCGLRTKGYVPRLDVLQDWQMIEDMATEWNRLVTEQKIVGGEE